MAENQNFATLLKVLDAITRNDIDAAAEGVPDDVVFIVRGQSSVSGAYTGREALAGVLGRILNVTDGTMSGVPEVVLAEGDNVMMYMRVIGTRSDGRRYDSHQAYLYRFRNGRLIEGQTIPVDQHAFAEFLADELAELWLLRQKSGPREPPRTVEQPGGDPEFRGVAHV